ncbi:proline-rich protein 2-like isoform X2 [Hippopotamus amphibius kiboko]|uniref:proline-rich protein 2-like isoform X2 n=1 Tax=Hippopotamus amphibius kiboko TaxID=575201 RepID=UPI00259A35D6|nr:proline-rich protein 2-like isoform X2 [Hippopotamus amphibius kiboko]
MRGCAVRNQRRPRGRHAGSGPGGAAPAAHQPGALQQPRPPAHLETPGHGRLRGRGPWTPPVTAQDTSFGPVPPASPPPPALPGSPSVPREGTETPLPSASSPAPDPASPEDPLTQGGPRTPREDAAGPSLGSPRGVSAPPGVGASPGLATSSRSRGTEPPGGGPKKAPRSLRAQAARLGPRAQPRAGSGQPRARPHARRPLAARQGLRQL